MHDTEHEFQDLFTAIEELRVDVEDLRSRKTADDVYVLLQQIVDAANEVACVAESWLSDNGEDEEDD